MSNRAAAFMLGAVTLGGCAATAAESAHVRPRTTSAFAGFPGNAAFASSSKKSSKESPRAHACTAGSSKMCNELGDALAVKHAHAQAHHWYVTSCERVSNAMLPNATRLVEVSREIARLNRAPGDGPNRHLMELKDEASEIKSRIHGCLDAGETLVAGDELKQSLKYYDAVCEFSTILPMVSEAVPSLEHVTETACAAGERVRAQLSGVAPFSARLFADVGQEPKVVAAKQSKAKSEEGMVFSESDL